MIARSVMTSILAPLLAAAVIVGNRFGPAALGALAWLAAIASVHATRRAAIGTVSTRHAMRAGLGGAAVGIETAVALVDTARPHLAETWASALADLLWSGPFAWAACTAAFIVAGRRGSRVGAALAVPAMPHSNRNHRRKASRIAANPQREPEHRLGQRTTTPFAPWRLCVRFPLVPIRSMVSVPVGCSPSHCRCCGSGGPGATTSRRSRAVRFAPSVSPATAERRASDSSRNHRHKISRKAAKPRRELESLAGAAHDNPLCVLAALREIFFSFRHVRHSRPQ